MLPEDQQPNSSAKSAESRSYGFHTKCIGCGRIKLFWNERSKTSFIYFLRISILRCDCGTLMYGRGRKLTEKNLMRRKFLLAEIYKK